MYLKNSSTTHSHVSKRSRAVRYAFAALVVAAATAVGASAPASAFYPPEGGGIGGSGPMLDFLNTLTH